MFGKSKKQPASPSISYDKTGKTPVIRSSICTGEQVAGFKDAQGTFHEIMLLRNTADLQEFLRTFDLTDSDIKREY